MWNRKAVVSEEVVTFLKKNGILEDGKEQRLIKKIDTIRFQQGFEKGGIWGSEFVPNL